MALLLKGLKIWVTHTVLSGIGSIPAHRRALRMVEEYRPLCVAPAERTLPMLVLQEMGEAKLWGKCPVEAGHRTKI